MCRIVQCEDCMRANGYHKYELLTCVSIIQRKGCMGATEDRKYELLACVSIHSTREQVRAQVRAVECVSIIQSGNRMRANEYCE